jgi:hypothetical protein
VIETLTAGVLLGLVIALVGFALLKLGEEP